MDDLLYRYRQIDIVEFLSKNKLFYELETAMGKIILLMQDNKLKFLDTQSGRFTEEVFCKIVDETTGFIGCFKQGSFYSSLHHSRALIELYSTIVYCLSSQGIEKNVLELFDKYNVLRRHILFLEINDGNNYMNFSKENQQLLKDNYSSIDTNILEIFEYKNINEARKKMKNSSNWVPSHIIKFNKIIEKAGVIHMANYEKLCYYAHFSPLTNRRNNIMFGLRNDWEEMLTITADYSFKCYAFMRDIPDLDIASKQLLEEVFIDLSGTLYPKVVKLLENSKPF
jgi:hypothetical protein